MAGRNGPDFHSHDIEHHLARTLGTEISRDTISKITDGVLEEVKAWQARPLDPVYPARSFQDR